jgi:hypothetical protein
MAQSSEKPLTHQAGSGALLQSNSDPVVAGRSTGAEHAESSFATTLTCLLTAYRLMRLESYGRSMARTRLISSIVGSSQRSYNSTGLPASGRARRPATHSGWWSRSCSSPQTVGREPSSNPTVPQKQRPPRFQPRSKTAVCPCPSDAIRRKRRPGPGNVVFEAARGRMACWPRSRIER